MYYSEKCALINFPKSIQEAEVELEIRVWSSKDHHINHQSSVPQHHSLPILGLRAWAHI